MKISFCTTCKGRLFHLSKTLPVNLQEAAGFDVEFIVLDYNCQDGTKEWVLKNIQNPQVRVFKTVSPVYYDSSHAKNIAHRLATGDILFSLDADNMITKGCIEFIINNFGKDRDVILRGGETPGRYGQIAIYRDKFFRMRGYDEGLPAGWGADDSDLAERAVAFGLTLIKIPMKFTNIIAHSPEMRMENFLVKDWKESNRIKQAARQNSIVSNLNHEWGVAADLI